MCGGGGGGGVGCVDVQNHGVSDPTSKILPGLYLGNSNVWEIDT